MTTVAAFNMLDRAAAERALASCCGATRWIAGVLARRPFASRADVIHAADRVWNALDPADWLEAFRHHPRIGEATSAAPRDALAKGWSSAEQSAMTTARPDVRARLATLNRLYEERFGFIYIVCATGRSAEEMLALAEARLQHDADEELHVAAREQRAITRLRLGKLLDPDS